MNCLVDGVVFLVVAVFASVMAMREKGSDAFRAFAFGSALVFGLFAVTFLLCAFQFFVFGGGALD